LKPDETLLVQSGKPVGVVRTTEDAPRVLIANSNLVPHWATQEVFDDLSAKGLMMYGQMTAGSWIYIGTQGILQGTYETFAECGRGMRGAVPPDVAVPPRQPVPGALARSHRLSPKAATSGGTGPLAGRLVVTAGCGGMGGAQPLAVTLCGGVCLIADVDLTRLERRLKDKYLDEIAGESHPPHQSYQTHATYPTSL